MGLQKVKFSRPEREFDGDGAVETLGPDPFDLYGKITMNDQGGTIDHVDQSADIRVGDVVQVPYTLINRS